MPPERQNADDLRVVLANERDNAIELIESVIKLGQMELRRDAKQISRMASQGMLYAALLLAGYCFLIVGVVWSLSPWLPGWAILLSLALIHVLAGVWGLRRLSAKVQTFHPMQVTADELTKSIASLKGSFPHASSSTVVAVADGRDPRSGGL